MSGRVIATPSDTQAWGSVQPASEPALRTLADGRDNELTRLRLWCAHAAAAVPARAAAVGGIKLTTRALAQADRKQGQVLLYLRALERL